MCVDRLPNVLLVVTSNCRSVEASAVCSVYVLELQLGTKTDGNNAGKSGSAVIDHQPARVGGVWVCGRIAKKRRFVGFTNHHSTIIDNITDLLLYSLRKLAIATTGSGSCSCC
jgi:hypothetical protein